MRQKLIWPLDINFKMDTVRRITRNTAYVLGGNMLAALMTFLINAYIARYLGSEVFGRYSFVFAYLAFFMVISVFGIDAILVREFSRSEGRSNRLLSAGIIIKLATSFLASLISAVLIMFLPYSSSIRLAVILASIGLVFYSVAQTLSALFQARLEMIYSSIATILSRLVFLGLTAYVVLTNGGFVKMVVASSAAFMAQLALMYVFSRKKFTFIKPDMGITRAILVESWPLALMNLFITAYFRIGVVILSLVKGTEQVGFYSAAYMITEAPAMISVAFMTSMFPLMSLYFKSSNAQFKEIYVKSFKYMAILGMPIVVGGFLLRKEIISLVYGASYSVSASAFGILIFGCVLMILNVVLASTITAIDRQKLNMFVVGLATALNLVLNLAMIPKLGFIGTAIAAVATELLIFLGFGYFVYKETKIIPTEGLLNVLGASLVMGLFIVFTNLQLILTFLIAIPVYGIALLLLRTFDSRDREFIARIIRK